jgi:hypothetical protein
VQEGVLRFDVFIYFEVFPETGVTLLSHVDSSADEDTIRLFVSKMRKAVAQFGHFTKPWRYNHTFDRFYVQFTLL